MPARPELTRPGDDAIAAATSRTLSALTAVFQALQDGEHTLNLAVQRTDHAFVTGRTDLSIATEPIRLAVRDEDEFCALHGLLVLALEGSTMRSAVLVATTAAQPTPRACGWTVHGGWLHPTDTAALQTAVIPCPDLCALTREVYQAPALPLPGTGKENPRT
ncbi:hypothetical protein GCM10010277_80070 [Streptomyces longisporoflavus]|uniref:hypothetical protein n=1 Tax=Streptomyces longisporoflavus TaxID=28044 RepID=UPI00167D2A94|nr:hypothetical protein [Streptomyces longisporoflavus]GGV69761.1 hypothetical protein GCM10010277_80070 [Streptomyces longisporoflavus]